ncbi:MAG: hypothetical protein ACI81Y_001809 [Glaciecola sp.]|jgi:hypothetical protein
MNKTLLFLLSALITITMACNQPEPSDVTGLWKLHTMEVKDSLTGKWSEFRDGMQGYLLYDSEDNVALHLIKKGYENRKDKFRNFTDTMSLDKLKHITGNYNYIGKYSVNEDIVSHHRLSHSNPNDWGVTVERRFKFSADTLIIKPVEEKNARLRLKWLRDQK